MTEDFVACLYRLVEIPRLVGFSVQEGMALWTCMGSEMVDLVEKLAMPPGTALYAAVRTLLQRTILTADWLHEHDIDVSTLLTLVATRHRTVATEEILQFLANIQATASSDMTRFSAHRMEDTVIEDQLARHVGAQFSLTAGTARAMIRWIDKVIGAMDADLADYSSKEFWQDVASPRSVPAPSTVEEILPRVVQYCHLLGQFAFACHLTGLQEQDISLIIAPDDGISRLYVYPEDDIHVVPPLTLNTIFWLYAYAEWREALPGSVAEARLHFGNSSPSGSLYKINDFGALNGWDPELAVQVWTLLGHATLADMRQVHEWANWMKVAMDLQLSHDDLGSMFALSDPWTVPTVTGDLLKTVAPSILSAVNALAPESKASLLVEQLAENRRDALLRYYLHNVVPDALKPKIKTPDDLYEYMLIDPQVSAKVKTSRIAEAIASVQLYMHRCREGLEPDIDGSALASEMRPGGYFAFWDAYNKRYGTWAGLQRLLRYPASYIDPSLRYVKTTAFLALENSLSQGRLTPERAQTAFTDFVEETCNALDIEYIDGYESGARTDPLAVPAMVLLGKSKGTTPRYFCRHTHPQSTEEPQAWTEWMPVAADIPTYTAESEQPSIVYFADAIRVVWWTWKSTGTTTESNSIKESHRLQLHVATLGNDGQWRTRDYKEETIWLFSPRLAYVATSGEGESEQLHFIAPDADSPILGVVRVLDRFLDMSVGDTDSRHYRLIGPDFVEEGRYSLRYVRRSLQPTHLPVVRGVSEHGEFEIFSKYAPLAGDGFRDELIILTSVTGHFKIVFEGVTHPEINLDLEAGTFRRVSINVSLALGIDITVFFTAGESGSGLISITVPVLIEAGWDNIGGMATLKKSVPYHNYTYLVRSDGRLTIFGLSTHCTRLFRKGIKEGFDSLLSYTTQTAPVEPEFAANSPILWSAGVGSYMWELFFHVPFLIACRLLDEQRFDEAETWLRRIFSPSGYVDAEGNLETDEGGNVRYWNVRPLQEDTTWGPITSAGTDDPDAVAMADPMHYKLAVYQRWMQLYMDRGDMAYRQQTRDTMTEAKMWYVQASQLLGRRPYFHGLLPGYWADPSLATAAENTAPALDALEAIIGDNDVPRVPTHPGQVRIIDGVFLPPVDDGSLVWWDRFADRLYNLRHGLSLDGHPMSLPLYETPVSPRELQLRRLAADGGAGGLDPSMVAMPSQRFISLLDRARAAVQQLMQFGATLQGILERRDADALSVLQQTQQVNIQAMTKEVHTFQIKMLEHNADGLDVARAQASDRQNHYTKLASEYMNFAEIGAMAMRAPAPLLLQGSVGATISAAALDMMPNTWIAGMAAGVGGTTWSAVARAVAEGLTTQANALEMCAGALDTMAGYERREEEWQLQADQAAREVEQLDTQINASKAAIEQAMKQATQLETEQGFAQAVLDVLTTRFTGKDLFSWQSGRMSTLYYQLYDATLSLCAWAQKAYHFETQDSTPFLQPGAWDDRYQGLLAGESLALGLQRLERAYLSWDQRVLEVERTVSLNALAAKSLGALIADALDAPGGDVVSDKLKVTYVADVLSLQFTLGEVGIFDDYPSGMGLGTLRRIKSIAVTLPAVLGAYEDVRALLAYSGGAVGTLPSGCTAVTLSKGIVDHGVFSFDFNDGKYLPFEGIPVDDEGTLSLRFPNAAGRPQEDMLRSLSDVIMHIRYTILSE